MGSMGSSGNFAAIAGTILEAVLEIDFKPPKVMIATRTVMTAQVM